MIRNKYEQARVTPLKEERLRKGDVANVPRRADRFMREVRLAHKSPKKVSSVLSTVTLGNSLDLVLLSDSVAVGTGASSLGGSNDFIGEDFTNALDVSEG